MLDLLSRTEMFVFLQVLLPSLLLQPSVQGRSDKGISNSQFSNCCAYDFACYAERFTSWSVEALDRGVLSVDVRTKSRVW